MMGRHDQVLQDILDLLRELAEDWEYEGDISRETMMITDIGLASLDLVVLANAVQQQYDCVMPFSTLFAEIGQRERQDISVGEWVDFICTNLESPAGAEDAEGS